MPPRSNGIGRWIAIAFVILMTVSVLAESGKVEKIRTAFSERLEAVYLRDEEFDVFRKRYPELFPVDPDPPWILVRKEKMNLDGKSITIGASYIQLTIHVPMERLIRYLESPQWFQALYNLDADACVEGGCGEGRFHARIFKRVPLIPNQDFVLGFSSCQSGCFWFQRAQLVEDRKKFAVRDNLKILESVQGGTVYREISLIYPRRWWARAAGATFRKVMRRELHRLVKALQCVVEGKRELDPAAAAECWEQVD